MRRFLLPVLLIVTFASSARAQTLTVRDIVELTKAGLAEPALLALVEVHRSVFPVDKETLLMLKAQGVSDNVIVAMIRSGRDPLPVPMGPQAPTPAVIVDRGDGTQPLIVSDRAPAETKVVVVETPPSYEERRSRSVEERVREVPVPVYVPVPTRRIDRDDDRRDPPKRVEPVYWGYDGKLRPDAWKPSEPEKKPRPKKGNN